MPANNCWFILNKEETHKRSVFYCLCCRNMATAGFFLVALLFTCCYHLYVSFLSFCVVFLYYFFFQFLEFLSFSYRYSLYHLAFLFSVVTYQLLKLKRWKRKSIVTDGKTWSITHTTSTNSHSPRHKIQPNDNTDDHYRKKKRKCLWSSSNG